METEKTAAVADNRVIYDMDIDLYHKHPAVSRSGLMLINKSPQHYWWEYLSGQAEKIDTDPLRIGGAFHTLVLEPHLFGQRAIVLPADAPKKPSVTQLNAKKPSDDTIAAIAWWQQFEQQRNGRVVLSNDEFTDLQDMATALLNQPASAKIFAEKGAIEASYFWYDADYRVHVKARPDFVMSGGRLLLDVKTTADASYDEFQRSIVKYGYDIQAWMQMEGVERVTGKRPENFVFACVEKDKPHATAFYVADNDMLECGKTRYHKLMARYAECQAKGVWDGYGSLIRSITVPQWFTKKLENGEA